MYVQQILTWKFHYFIIKLLAIFRTSLCFQTDLYKYEESKTAALDTFHDFYYMFNSCMLAPMPDQHLLMDDLKNFVNYPSKTTIGVAPKFTKNRKFFINMINSAAFKDMLAKDEDELRRDVIKKLKYCNQVLMDPTILKEFYDREIDNAKLM